MKNGTMRINRNIVECKEPCPPFSPAPTSVLIETLWNVKINKWAEKIRKAFVLIETLWNVKKYSLDPPMIQSPY